MRDLQDTAFCRMSTSAVNPAKETPHARSHVSRHNMLSHIQVGTTCSVTCSPLRVLFIKLPSHVFDPHRDNGSRPRSKQRPHLAAVSRPDRRFKGTRTHPGNTNSKSFPENCGLGHVENRIAGQPTQPGDDILLAHLPPSHWHVRRTHTPPPLPSLLLLRWGVAHTREEFAHRCRVFFVTFLSSAASS